MIESLRFVRKKAAKEAAKTLMRYLENNAQRIDYKHYLELGLMIGSGVVESSNRRVVTQRLKQSGMHWSNYGANAVIALLCPWVQSLLFEQFRSVDSILEAKNRVTSAK